MEIGNKHYKIQQFWSPQAPVAVCFYSAILRAVGGFFTAIPRVATNQTDFRTEGLSSSRSKGIWTIDI